MAQRGKTINPSKSVDLVPANDRGPVKPFGDDYELDPVIAETIANFCSLAAMHAPTKLVRQNFLNAAAYAWDGANLLRRAGGAHV